MIKHTETEPRLSIVIPTKREAQCILPLLDRIKQATQGADIQVIFVDDSDDETPDVITKAKEQFNFDIKLIARPPDERIGGLGGAVVAGIQAARAPWVVVMDADLQHPPALIPQMLDMAIDTQADAIICSRFLRKDGLINSKIPRTLISRSFTLLTRLSFPKQLFHITDPLSGYFLIRREAISTEQLKARGYKVLLEILVCHPSLRVAEIPFQIEERLAEKSKASMGEALQFLSHLLSLRLRASAHLFQFLLVGASGLIVNSLLMAAFVELLGLHYLLSAVLATQGSTLSNFILSERWVFGSGGNRQSFTMRLGSYFLMNNFFVLIRGPLLVLLVSGFGIHYLIANLGSLAMMALIRFVLADLFIWSKRPASEAADEFYYDIHSIVQLESNVRLPELERFLVHELFQPPDILICVKSSSQGKNGTGSACREGGGFDQNIEPIAGRTIEFDEGLGDLGFWIKINPGEVSTVVTSPLLRRSPHVLYTNVVEPLLRWTLVRKGYALVHGACLSYKRQGVLVTARTDTGKTTTILKTLSNYPFCFISDDMTILGEDGTLLSYPKPLTISLHTLQAVNQATLTLKERLALQIQSRMHSKSGRWFGMMIDQLKLPAATLNALVQMVIPPPKYPVQRLIPDVRVATKSCLRYMAVIEKGDELERILKQEEALDALIHNAEDAYGFPPYPQLASQLSTWKGEDLHMRERQIIDKSLQNVPAAHLRDPNYAWWRRIPALYNGDPFGEFINPLSSRFDTVPRGSQMKPLQYPYLIQDEK
jgi:glycosyltransferase involved in cell wall biosynthesis